MVALAFKGFFIHVDAASSGTIDFPPRFYKANRKHFKKSSLAFRSLQPLPTAHKKKSPGAWRRPETSLAMADQAMPPLIAAEMEVAVCKWASFHSHCLHLLKCAYCW